MSCKFKDQIYRYHDGALPSAQQRAVESHTADCSDCRALLAELSSLSALVKGADLVSMPPEAVERLHRAVSARLDRGLLRITSWLTAAAAAVLILALSRMPLGSADEDAAGSWEALALNPPSESRDMAGSDLPLGAQWMADEFSSNGVGDLQ